MTATDVQLELVNQALTLAGEDILVELNGDTFLGQVAITHYDAIVEEELETANYKFAVKTSTPALLTARAAEPLQYQYQLPADALKLVTVQYVNDAVLDGEDYLLEGNKVRTRFDTDVTFKHVYRPDEDYWPRRFKAIIVERMKAVFLDALEQHDEARAVKKDAATTALIARHAEAAQGRNSPQPAGSIIDRRRGVAGRR